MIIAWLNCAMATPHLLSYLLQLLHYRHRLLERGKDIAAALRDEAPPSFLEVIHFGRFLISPYASVAVKDGARDAHAAGRRRARLEARQRRGRGRAH